MELVDEFQEGEVVNVDNDDKYQVTSKEPLTLLYDEF